MFKYKNKVSKKFLMVYESRIKTILQFAKITHEDLAKACNVSRSTISSFLAPANRGHENPMYILAVMYVIDAMLARKSHDIWELYINKDVNHDQWKERNNKLNKARDLWLDIERYYLEHGFAEEEE